MSLNFMFVISAVLLQQCLVHSASQNLPSNFIKCKKDDPNLNSCLQNAVTDAIRKMKTDGLPSLGVFPLDPLAVDEMYISSGSKNSPINLNIQFKNMKILGISKMNITNYDADLNGAKITTLANCPQIVLDSDYVADGKVMLLPVTGKGKCKFILDDMDTRNELIFKPQQKNGRTHWAIQDYKFTFQSKKMRVHFDGLLNGDKRLNEGINDILNQNWQIFLDEIRPQFERSCGEIFKEITARVFNKVPIDNIFD